MLCSIGAAQAIVLREHVVHAGRWIPANALGWLAGLPLPFIALAIAPEDPAVLRAAVAVVSGVGMGAVVAAVTGVFLVRLLREPRPVRTSAEGNELNPRAAGRVAPRSRPPDPRGVPSS